MIDYDTSTALADLKDFLDIAERHIYPCPDKPNSMFGKLEKAKAAFVFLHYSNNQIGSGIDARASLDNLYSGS